MTSMSHVNEKTRSIDSENSIFNSSWRYQSCFRNVKADYRKLNLVWEESILQCFIISRVWYYD